MLRSLFSVALAALVVLVGAAPALAVPLDKKVYDCVVVPGGIPQRPGGPAGNVAVTVPRLKCKGKNPQQPSGGGVQGNGEGGQQGNGGNGTGGSGGHLPFTGFDLESALLEAGLLLGAGLVLCRTGRRSPGLA